MDPDTDGAAELGQDYKTLVLAEALLQVFRLEGFRRQRKHSQKDYGIHRLATQYLCSERMHYLVIVSSSRVIIGCYLR